MSAIIICSIRPILVGLCVFVDNASILITMFTVNQVALQMLAKVDT